MIGLFTSDDQPGPSGTTWAAIEAQPGVGRASVYRAHTDNRGQPDSSGGRLVLVELLASSQPWAATVAATEQTLGARAWGVFEPLATHGEPAADPFESAGLLVALLDNTEPERDADFHRWYNQVHLGDVCGAGHFAGATRYANLAPVADQAGRFLALYPSDGADVGSQQRAVIAARAGMVIWPSIRLVLAGTYRRLIQ